MWWYKMIMETEFCKKMLTFRNERLLKFFLFSAEPAAFKLLFFQYQEKYVHINNFWPYSESKNIR